MGLIKGNNDGKNGRNDTYKIGGRGNVPRKTLVKEVENGQHPGYSTIKVKGEKYVRSNPNNNIKDNVNQ